MTRRIALTTLRVNVGRQHCRKTTLSEDITSEDIPAIEAQGNFALNQECAKPEVERTSAELGFAEVSARPRW